MKKHAKKHKQPEFDEDQIRRTLKVSPARRLAFLEGMIRFFDQTMSPDAKRISRILKAKGF